MHSYQGNIQLPKISSVLGILYGIWLGISVSNYPLPGLEMSLAIVMAPAVILIVLCCAFLQNNFLSLHHLIIKLYLIYGFFLLFACLSTILSGGRLSGIQPLITLPVLPLFTYILCHQFQVKKNVYSGLFLILLIGCFYTVYTGFFENRAQGMTTHPNSSAVALVMGFVFTASFFHKTQKGWQKIFLLIVESMMFLGILLTGSRTGFATFFIALTVMFLGNRALRKWIIPSIILLCLLFLFVDFSYQMNRVIGVYEVIETGESNKPGSKNIKKRLEANRIALKIFTQQPFLGVGIGGVKKKQSQLTSFDTQTHSGYISLMTETGLVGTSLFLLFLFVLTRIILRIEKNQYKSYPHSLEASRSISTNSLKWLISGHFALVVAALAWDIFKEKVFWVWVSLVMIELANQTRGKYKNRSRSRSNRAILPS